MLSRWRSDRRTSPDPRVLARRGRAVSAVRLYGDPLKPKLSNRPWDDWELAILDDAREKKTPWREVAEKLPRRTALGCALKSKNRHGRGRLNGWTEIEDAAVRKHYPALGWKGVIRNWPAGVPERPCGAIHQRAKRLGLVQKNEPNPTLDRALRECYADGKIGPVKRAAAIAGVEAKNAQYRARCLGLSVRPHPSKPWSEFELAMLEKHPEISAVCMSKRMKKAGYNRTPNAIVQCRCKTGFGGLGDWMGPTEVGKLLGGFDTSAVIGWIRAGLLKARMRGYATDHDHYLISQESLRNFVLAYPNRLRPHWALIDPMWLIRGLIEPDKGAVVHSERKLA